MKVSFTTAALMFGMVVETVIFITISRFIRKSLLFLTCVSNEENFFVRKKMRELFNKISLKRRKKLNISLPLSELILLKARYLADEF